MTKKIMTVTVERPYQSIYWGSAPPRPSLPPLEVCGEYRQEDTKGPWLRQVVQEFDPDLSLDVLVPKLQEWQGSYADTELYRDRDYVDDLDTWSLRGWRDATPEEVTWVRHALERQDEAHSSRARQRVEAARRVLREAGEL